MKTTIKRIIFTAISLLLLCAMVFGLSSCAFFKKNFAAPHEYLKYVQERSITSSLKSALSAYDTYKLNAENASKVSMESVASLKVNEDIADTLSAMIGMDMSWINDIAVKMNTGTKDKLSNVEMSLLAQEDVLATFSIITDGESGDNYLSIPEIFTQTMKISSEYMETDSVDIMEIIEKLPDGAKMAKVLNRYVAIYLSFITEAEKSEGELVADGVAQKCTVLTVDFTDRELADMVKTMISEAINDEELKQLVFDVCEIMETIDSYEEYDGEEMWAELVDEAENTLAEIEDEREFFDDEIDLIIVNYVDNGSNIIGRKIESVEDESSLFYAMATNADEFGLQIDMVDEGYEMLSVTCGGVYAKGKVSGEGDAYMYGEPMFAFKVKDVDAKLFEKDGTFVGTIEIPLNYYLDEDMLTEMGLDENTVVDLVIIGEDKTNAKMAIMLNGEEAIAIVLETKFVENGGEAIVVPTENVTEDEEQWLAGMSFDKFFENIRNSSLPDELVQVIQMAIMSAMMGGMEY